MALAPLLWAARPAPALAAPFVSRRIAVTVRGTGPDVILIPGLASGPAVWTGMMRAVPGYRWHLVHIRGFAGLAPDLNATGPVLDPVANDIIRYIATLDPRRPMVIGHSMGGTLGLMIAQRRASLVSRLMVVDMLPDGAEMAGGTSAGLGYLAGQLNGYLTGTKAGRQILADMVARSPGAQGSAPAVISQSLADLATRDLTPVLGTLTVPIDVVYGAPADPQLALAQTRRYRAAYSRARAARLIALRPSGHMVMYDQPAAFARAIRDFVTRQR